MGAKFQLCTVFFAITLLVVTVQQESKVADRNGQEESVVSEASIIGAVQQIWKKYHKRNSCKCVIRPDKGHYFADFTTAGAFIAPSTGTGVSWVAPLTGTNPCKPQGVLKLEPPSWASKLIIELCLHNPTDWSFNLGDSPSNNGWGGDFGHTWSSAEVHSKGDHTLVYRAYNGTNKKGLLINYFRNSVSSGPYKITVKKPGVLPAGDYVGINNYQGLDADIYDDLLFVWDTMYFGINRVVHGGGRVGTGLCFISIRWEA